MQQTLISLDLETTGLNPEVDRIIEVGAVKFAGSEIIDTFQSLINPQCEMSYRIKLLTGIQQQELNEAPLFELISGDLVKFIGDCPIIGQNISFDISFLTQKGINLSNPTVDTLDLAGIVFPGLMEKNLKSLVSQLELPQRRFHRALNDAQSTREVFLKLCHRMADFPEEIRSEIYHLSSSSRCLSLILQENIAPDKIQKGLRLDPLFLDELILNNRRSSLHKAAIRGAPTELQPLDLPLLNNLLSASGPFSRVFRTYEVRQGQIEMLSAIGSAINCGEHIIVEAGTGTGKSLAYLLPMTMFSLKNNTPIIVSTNTINLQEQLIQKDIPAVVTALGLENKLKTCQLKGRNNYLCLRRWNNLRLSADSSPEEAKLLIRTLTWLCQTITGDRGEINLSGIEPSLWSKINAQDNNCLGNRCPHYQRGTCFLQFARKEAQSAHLLVINHALLISDLVSGGKILPDSGYVVIDEAHHLEEETTKRLGFTYSQRDFTELLQTLLQSKGGRFTGILPELESLRDSRRGHALTAQSRWKALSEIILKVDAAKLRLTQFFEEISRATETLSSDVSEYERRVRINREKRQRPEWQRMMLSWENFNLVLAELLKGLREFVSDDTDYISGENERFASLMVELNAVIEQLCEMSAKTNNLILSPEQGMVYWSTLNTESGVSITGAPLEVSGWLKENFFSRRDCSVLTSATLAMGGNFQYIKQRLGLEQLRELIVESPFNYREAVLLLIPQDMPNPDNPRYQRELDESLLDLCCATEGRTLILFTSRNSLKSAHKYLSKPLEDRGVLVLGQGIDGTPRQLLTEFKANSNIILMGTNAFWEGIDVVGEALSVLVITRLPFNVPTDPLYAARAELLNDSFNQYAVPQAILRFKQGFGRLIRSSTDRGVVVVLDPRLLTKYYGNIFLKSLPACRIQKGVRRQIATDVLSGLKL